jgi:hypothetical protein
MLLQKYSGIHTDPGFGGYQKVIRQTKQGIQKVNKTKATYHVFSCYSSGTQKDKGINNPGICSAYFFAHPKSNR